MSEALEQKGTFENISAVLLGLAVTFAALATGAHDIWAATLVYCFAIVMSLVILINSCWSRRGPGIRLSGLPFILLIIAAFSLSHHFSIHPEESYLELMDWVASGLFFFISVNIFNEGKSLLFFGGTVSLVFFVEAITAVMQKLGYGPPILLEEPAGTLWNANFASAFYLLWAPVVYFQWRLKQQRTRKIPVYWTLVGVSMAVGLILASSTSALACLVIGVPCLIFYGRFKTIMKTHARLLGAAALAVASVLAVLVWFKYSQLYRWSYHGQWAPPTSRLTWWMSGVRMWLDHFWWGLGPGTYGSAYLAYKIGIGQNTLYGHSSVVTLLSETGLLGFVAVALFSIYILFQILRRISDADRYPFFIGVFLFALFGLVNVSYELFVNIMTAFIFLGILLAAVRPAGVPIRRSILAVGTALGLMSLIFVVSPFLASQSVVSGQEEFSRGQFSQAEEEFRSAAALDSSSSLAYEGLARTLAAENRLPEAVKAQEQAIHRNRLSGVLWWELGRFWELSGDKKQALAAYDQACRYHWANSRFQEDLKRLQGG